MVLQTLSEEAYRRLRKAIVRGVWAPGSRLAVKEISRELEIGASPVREALARLTGDGLVVAAGRRGFRVPKVERADLDDITYVRSFVEAEALRRSLQYGDDEWEAAVIAAFHRLDKCEENPNRSLDDWEKRNREFHEILISSCDSNWLMRIWKTLYDQHVRYRFISSPAAPIATVRKEHRQLRDLALARDADGIVKVNTKHNLGTAKSVTAREKEQEAPKNKS